MVSPAMEIETGNATALGHRKAPLSKQNAVETSVFVCEWVCKAIIENFTPRL